MKLDLKSLVGKTKEEAEELLEKNKIDYRIDTENGQPNGLTMDFVDSRVNLIIDDGKVTSYHMG